MLIYRFLKHIVQRNGPRVPNLLRWQSLRSVEATELAFGIDPLDTTIS